MAGRLANPGSVSAGMVRQGLRVFAVGDIHGRADLLGRMATLVAEDLSRRPTLDAVTVFLGDYIDRGPASSAVIERLRARDFPTPIVTLRGNHEQMLLEGLDHADGLRNWLVNGGVETALSYGLVLADGHLERLRDQLLDAIPVAHVDFLRATDLSGTIDGYFFCHAGIQPGIAVDLQEPETLLWIRKPFHRSTADHGCVVVHGHTPVAKPESRPNRINVDTGAFYTGRLTCVVLDETTRRFMET